jgi:hypothetical protein
VLGVHDLGDDGQARGRARAAQQLEPLGAHALERVGRGARLERAAAPRRFFSRPRPPR